MTQEIKRSNTTILIGKKVPKICPKCTNNEKLTIKKRGDFRLAICPTCGAEYFGS